MGGIALSFAISVAQGWIAGTLVAASAAFSRPSGLAQA